MNEHISTLPSFKQISVFLQSSEMQRCSQQLRDFSEQLSLATQPFIKLFQSPEFTALAATLCGFSAVIQSPEVKEFISNAAQACASIQRVSLMPKN